MRIIRPEYKPYATKLNLFFIYLGILIVIIAVFMFILTGLLWLLKVTSLPEWFRFVPISFIFCPVIGLLILSIVHGIITERYDKEHPFIDEDS